MEAKSAFFAALTFVRSLLNSDWGELEIRFMRDKDGKGNVYVFPSTTDRC